MKERRNHQRIGVSFPVECDLFSKKCYFYTVSKDLSNKGVKIVSDDFMPKGENLAVNINFINQLIRIKAEVVWCSKDSKANRYSAGLKFMEINKSNEKAITKFLNQIYNS